MSTNRRSNRSNCRKSYRPPAEEGLLCELSGATAEQAADWCEEGARLELVGLLPELLELHRYEDDQQLSECLTAADWFMRHFVPVLLRRLGEYGYAEIVERLAAVESLASLERAIAVCCSFTYLLDEAATRPFYLAVNALEVLAADPRFDGSSSPEGVIAMGASFGRRLAAALSAGAAVLSGDDPDGGGADSEGGFRSSDAA